MIISRIYPIQCFNQNLSRYFGFPVDSSLRKWRMFSSGPLVPRSVKKRCLNWFYNIFINKNYHFYTFVYVFTRNHIHNQIETHFLYNHIWWSFCFLIKKVFLHEFFFPIFISGHAWCETSRKRFKQNIQIICIRHISYMYVIHVKFIWNICCIFNISCCLYISQCLIIYIQHMHGMYIFASYMYTN